ncbi:MAG: DUF1284 domain-containing protein [Cellulosilyticaceae bacterium]
MNVLQLRPHHINCIFFYEGKGYSQEFVAQMNEMVAHLQMHPEQKIVLQKANDSLCLACPNLKEEVCLSDERIKQLDDSTLEAYGLQEGNVYTFKLIKENIYKNYEPEVFEKICQQCEWYKQGVCSKEKIAGQKQRWK